MKKNIKVIFVLIVLVILQSTVLDYIKIFNVKPDLILAAVILIGLYFNLKEAILLSFLAGFLKDALAITTIGLNTIILTFLAFLVSELSKKMVLENRFIVAVLIFVAELVQSLIISVLLMLQGRSIPVGIVCRFTIIGSVYTALFFLLLSRISRISRITI